MFSPIRSLYAIGRDASTAVLLSMVASTTMFTATPFLLEPISEQFGVSAGAAGLVSVVQVGMFAFANLVVPRIFGPGARLYRVSVVVFVVTAASSSLLSSFAAFLVVRGAAGVAAGTLTWVAWSDAMRHQRSMARVSAAGPVTALVAAPLIAWLAASAGFAAVYWLLAGVGVPALLATPDVSQAGPGVRVRSRSRSNLVLLGALSLMTTASASLFVFESVAASRLFGMSVTQTSLAFSANAAAGLLGARFSTRHRVPGRWLASMAPAALLTIIGGSAGSFIIGMIWWGFAFWMAVPGVLQMLSEHSLARDERAGDAQGLMAIGRSIGPAIGGSFVDGGSFAGLAVVSSVGLALAGAVVMGVQEGRDRLPVPAYPPGEAR